MNTNINMEEFADLPPGRFKISKTKLVEIVSACQERSFAEEVDLLEQLGSDRFMEAALSTSYKTGLPDNPDQIAEREKIYGTNRREVKKPKTICQLIWGALQDFILRILIISSLFSMTMSLASAESNEKRKTAWIEGFAIMIAVFVCASVTALNDYQKEKQFEKLNKVADDRKMIDIVRNGNHLNIHHKEVLVGDLVIIYEGMEIPADGFVVESAELQTDESAMTGETEHIKKNTLNECISRRNQIMAEGGKNTASAHDVFSPILLSGTRVVSGDGKFIVVVVGDDSCVGRIRNLLSQEVEATPLQKKLEAIATDIGKMGLASSMIIVLILSMRFLIDRSTDGVWDHSKHWKELLDYFIIGVTVVVVAIPEGLPLSVTISLAYSVKKMLKDNNLVRKLQACETMGGANMICSDKTGTLTQNKMTFTCFWNDNLIEIDNWASKINLSQYIPSPMTELFTQSIACNSSAILHPTPKGSKTEIALLEFLVRSGVDYETTRDKYHVVQKFPFNSARKRMGIIVELVEGGIGRKRLYVKGASELVLEACSNFHSFDKNVLPITASLRNKVEKGIEFMAGKALRTLALAYKNLEGNEDIISKDDKGVFAVEKKDLTLLAILGIKDILRQEVPEAVKQCKKAGIKVRMVTGDNKLTAKAIALDCGIIDPNDENSIVMEGSEFISAVGGVVCRKCKTKECECARDLETAKKEKRDLRVDTILNSDEFNRIYPHLDVLARSRPEDKYALVTGLIERDHVVAVTGDGTNDAAALKKADVGFAMGITGTEVAREASAIILLDDNFTSIIKAILWGRNIYDSIRKFLMFQLTVNVVAVLSTIIAAAILKQEVLQPVQMLWINLIMDSFASLALATEVPDIKLLDRKPHNRNEYIVSKKMFKHIIGQSIYQLIIMMIVVFAGEKFLPEYPDDFDNELRNKNLSLMIKYGNPDYTLVRSGRKNLITENTPDYHPYEDLTPSRHFTYVFNIFVFLQIFNFINARKLQDEFNVFNGLSKNMMFLGIILFIIVLQIMLISFGSTAVHCYKHGGLEAKQWIICVMIGSGSLFWAVILKLIPESICFQMGKRSIDPLHTNSQVMSLRRSYDENSLKRKYSGLGGNQNNHGSGNLSKMAYTMLQN